MAKLFFFSVYCFVFVFINFYSLYGFEGLPLKWLIIFVMISSNMGWIIKKNKKIGDED